MFHSKINAIKADGAKKLIWIPILMVLVVSVAIPGVIQMIVGLVLSSQEGQLITLASVVQMALTFFATLFVLLAVAKIKTKDLGFTKNASKDISKGLLYGFGAISVVALVLVVLGAVNMSFNFRFGSIPTIILAIVMFGFQGPLEELVYRSYLMPHFGKQLGMVKGILLSSVFFTLIHALNPGIGFMPIVNLFLASLVFSLIYYLTESFWLVGAAHAVWNFSQGIIYGSLVSGNPIKESIFTATPVKGMDFISGGSFGFEGGIITSLLGIILMVLLISAIKKKNRAYTRA
ncbi:CPBP family intramembrane glutamic endopeptidase [Streptococcus zalophi]|uniref:CPBP family intramembrane metalloprotease n=1 Tax=Streptococcus zalophi TaxID=640031 RepID=A0A934PAX0_9STRE|nr:type II CAAX endopeptidase family protein [Streptococcus zalophi]MBJ8350290.1 CPBP family intramembrane metalloprotease [Streptococcus zalophi]